MSHNNFSDRLVSAERMTPAFRDRYEMEVKAMLEKKLTRPQRVGYALSALMGVAFLVVFGALAILTGRELPAWARALFGVGSVFGLVWAILVGRIVITGKVNLRTGANTLVGLSWGFVVTVVTVLMIVGMDRTEPVKSVYMVLVGLVYLLVAAMFMILNRIDQSELKTREKLLEIELRLAELKESVEKRS